MEVENAGTDPEWFSPVVRFLLLVCVLLFLLSVLYLRGRCFVFFQPILTADGLKCLLWLLPRRVFSDYICLNTNGVDTLPFCVFSIPLSCSVDPHSVHWSKSYTHCFLSRTCLLVRTTILHTIMLFNTSRPFPVRVQWSFPPHSGRARGESLKSCYCLFISQQSGGKRKQSPRLN